MREDVYAVSCPRVDPVVRDEEIRMARFDALRGLAAVLVLGGHCALYIPFGWVAVPFFFVLTGYFLARSWETGFLKDGRFFSALRVFFVRRFYRIYPLYWGYLSVLLLLFLFSGLFAGPFFSLFMGYFGWLRFFGYQDMTMWYSQFWSLSVQLQFYLLIPFFLYFFRGIGRVVILWLFVVLAPILRVGLWFLFGDLLNWGDFLSLVYSCPLTYLDAFALGVLAWVSPIENKKDIWDGLGVYLVFIAIVLLSMQIYGNPGPLWGVSLGFPWLMGNSGQWVWGYSLLALFFYFLVMGVGRDDVLSGFLDNFLFRYLGRISYGIYVFHLPIVLVVLYIYGARDFRLDAIPSIPLTAFLLALFASVAVASLSYYFLELPFLRKRPAYG